MGSRKETRETVPAHNIPLGHKDPPEPTRANVPEVSICLTRETFGFTPLHLLNLLRVEHMNTNSICNSR